MGERLANEVNSYIKDYCPGNYMERLSFLGHSLGGVIIRAALPLLETHKSKMFNLITLSSPHLGCVYSSALVDVGIWAI